MLKTIQKWAHQRSCNNALRKINALEKSMQEKSDEELKEYSRHLQEAAEKGLSLDELLPKAFALVREAANRVLHKKPYDVQMIGGYVLHQGNVAEQATGEGKTITSLAPAYLNALTGDGVHIVTVNDYLAERDAEEMGKVYKFLGLSVGRIYPFMPFHEKKKAYACDIVYGTAQEFGFDYLKDNMVRDNSEKVQLKLHYCIIDEVDSILIDEARTPLIISKEGNESTDMYIKADKVAKKMRRGEDKTEMTKLEQMEYDRREKTQDEILREGDFQVDEKYKTIILSDAGVQKVEVAFAVDNLGSSENSIIHHHINQALRANYLMKRDVDYLVNGDGEVLIVDESTGRAMEGRRFSDGLHQAIEAKEGVAIKEENETAATITLQNYFRLYDKISGMTGTAKTEEDEFRNIYGMRVEVIPNNKPLIREDKADIVYASRDLKEKAVYDEAMKMVALGRPVLIGTASIEASERLSRAFKRMNCKHQVLNAKSSMAKREAFIIAQAGRSKTITIATNMAGRGTDILLGGNPEYLALEKLEKEGLSPEEIEIATSFIESNDEEEKRLKQKYQKLLSEEKKLCEEDRKKVVQAGGLAVIGTEKHDSRRIDNQLRGRSGRQGDPGSSVFIVSLTDNLFKLFGGSIMKSLSDKMIAEDMKEPIPSGGMLGRSIQNAQKNIETQNFEQRKHVLEYDEIDSVQREEVYRVRNTILDGDDVDDTYKRFIKAGSQEIAFNLNALEMDDSEKILELNKLLFERSGYHANDIKFDVDSASKHIQKAIDTKLKAFLDMGASKEAINVVRNYALLKSIDEAWRIHLILLQNLKDSTRMSSFGQIQPLEVYKKEAADMFQHFIQSAGYNLVEEMLNIQAE